MECPNGHGKLQQMLFHDVEVDYCPDCLGIWFDKEEMALAKNSKDEQFKWMDVDLWRDKGRFQFSSADRRCPSCRVPFVEVAYDHSSVTIDFCKHCQGVWLDRGEFKQIMLYLKKKFDYEVLHHYTKNLATQLWEVFTGPARFRDEVEDVMMLLKLLNYKFLVQYPLVNSWVENSQK